MIAIAEETEVDNRSADSFLRAFESIVSGEVSEGSGKVIISNFVKFERKDTPAKASRPGRNPATGEQMMFAAKPASVKIRITPLKRFKDEVLANAPKPKKAPAKKATKKGTRR